MESSPVRFQLTTYGGIVSLPRDEDGYVDMDLVSDDPVDLDLPDDVPPLSNAAWLRMLATVRDTSLHDPTVDTFVGPAAAVPSPVDQDPFEPLPGSEPDAAGGDEEAPPLDSDGPVFGRSDDTTSDVEFDLADDGMSDAFGHDRSEPADAPDLPPDAGI
jgi:hypothetical protein